MNKEDWVEYFELINGRKPSPQEFKSALDAGDFQLDKKPTPSIAPLDQTQEAEKPTVVEETTHAPEAGSLSQLAPGVDPVSQAPFTQATQAPAPGQVFPQAPGTVDQIGTYPQGFQASGQGFPLAPSSYQQGPAGYPQGPYLQNQMPYPQGPAQQNWGARAKGYAQQLKGSKKGIIAVAVALLVALLGWMIFFSSPLNGNWRSTNDGVAPYITRAFTSSNPDIIEGATVVLDIKNGSDVSAQVELQTTFKSMKDLEEKAGSTLKKIQESAAEEGFEMEIKDNGKTILITMDKGKIDSKTHRIKPIATSKNYFFPKEGLEYDLKDGVLTLKPEMNFFGLAKITFKK